MKKQLGSVLGALAASVMLLVAVPASARAADGVVFVNGRAFENPSGCLQLSQGPTELEINNDTAAVLAVYPGPDCDGPRVADVGAYGRGFATGTSILVVEPN